RPGPGPARARAPRQARGARGGRGAPRARPHRLAALHDALPPRGRARALRAAHVARSTDARIPSAAQGGRAHGGGRRPGRVPGRRRDAARVLPRRLRRAPPHAAARAPPRRRALDAPRGHAAAFAVRLPAAPRVGLGLPRRGPRRGAAERHRGDAPGLERQRRAAPGGARRRRRGGAAEDRARAPHARRVPRAVVPAERFSAFLLRRHHLHPDHRLTGPAGVLAALELLQGEDFPARVWEEELLSARVEGYAREWLDRLGLSGETVWTPFERRPGRVGVALRENVGWLREAAAAAPEIDARTKNVLLHLQ